MLTMDAPRRSPTTRFLSTLLRIVATGLWVLLLVVIPLGLPISEAYWATAFLSCLIFYVAFETEIKTLLPAIAAAAILGCLHQYARFKQLRAPSLGLCLAELGLGALLVVGIRILWASHAPTRKRLIADVVTPSAALLVLLFASNNLVNVMGIVHAKTMDLYAFSFDGSLGFQPSFVIGQWIQKYPWFGWPTVAMYYCILLPLTFAYVAHMKMHRGQRFRMLEIFFTASFLGYLFYSLFPAAGPVYIFGKNFPWHTLPYALGKRLLVERIPLATNVMRNALPSLHMTWALLIWWNMKRLSQTFFWAAFVYVLFTICGTLGTGEHYVVDLVTAMPFALMVQAICTGELPLRSSIRSVALIGGFSGVLIWVGLLRYGHRLFWISPAVPWALVAITITLSLLCAVRLLQSAERASFMREAIMNDKPELLVLEHA